MPLRTSLPAPFALYDGEIASTSATAGAANTAYLVGVVLYAPAVLTSIRCRFSAGGSGHFDVGVYDATGANNAPNNLLGNAASTAISLATSSALQTKTLLQGNIALAPGRYWLALWIDNATDTIIRSNAAGTAGQQVLMSGTTTGPLPALASSFTGLANNNSLKPIIVGLLSGGWS